MVLLGDLNLPHAKWDLSVWSAGASRDEQDMIKALYNVTLENFLTQQVECPTQLGGGGGGNIQTCSSQVTPILCTMCVLFHLGFLTTISLRHQMSLNP